MRTYITKYNAKNIIHNMDLSSIDTNEEVYKIDFKWFNDYEVKHLLAFKLLYSNPDDFFKLYKKKETPIDTQNWVFEGVYPAYHNSPACDKLNSDYLNIEIPEKIKTQREAKILEFRNWVKENLQLIDNQQDFMDRIRLRFVLSENPKIDFKKNGGFTFQQDIDLETLETTIQNIIQGANKFYTKSDENRLILDHFGKSAERQLKYKDMVIFPPPTFGWAKIQEVLTKFVNNFKEPLIYILQEYYRIKYNPLLEFKGKLLDQLGFRACKSCTNSSLKLDNESSAFINKPLNEEEIQRRVLELDRVISRNSLQSIFGEIIPVKIEQSIELPDRNIVTLHQLNVTKSHEVIYGIESIFSEVINSNGEKVYYENRYCMMQIPRHVEAFEPINTMLSKYPKYRIYRIISPKPILSDSEDAILKSGEKSLQDFVASFERIKYEGKSLFLRYFFSKTNREDIFRS